MTTLRKHERRGRSTRLLGWCVAAVTAVGWAGRCPAQLRFEKTTVTVPSEGQETLTAEFPFEVGEAGQVTITKVEADCSCAAGLLEKKIYEPGEKGKIKLQFKVGDNAGPQEKRLAITASDQPQPHILTLLAQLPVVFDFSPRTVYWDHASALTEKVVTFQVAADHPAMVALRAESDLPAVSVSVREIVPGRKFEFHLTPAATNNVLVAKIKVVATDEKQVERTFFCFAMVKPLPQD